MIPFSIFDENGRVLRTGVAPEQSVSEQAQPGELWMVGLAPDGSYIQDPESNPVAIPIPERPSRYHEFDYVEKRWKLPLDCIDRAKISAKLRINTEWKAAEKVPFEAYGKTFDADDKAIQRILGAAQAAVVAKNLGQALSITWTCADNSTLLMDADMLAAIPIIIAQAADVLHQRYLTRKAQIDAATTLEEIDAVVW